MNEALGESHAGTGSGEIQYRVKHIPLCIYIGIFFSRARTELKARKEKERNASAPTQKMMTDDCFPRADD